MKTIAAISERFALMRLAHPLLARSPGALPAHRREPKGCVCPDSGVSMELGVLPPGQSLATPKVRRVSCTRRHQIPTTYQTAPTFVLGFADDEDVIRVPEIPKLKTAEELINWVDERRSENPGTVRTNRQPSKARLLIPSLQPAKSRSSALPQQRRIRRRSDPSRSHAEGEFSPRFDDRQVSELLRLTQRPRPCATSAKVTTSGTSASFACRSMRSSWRLTSSRSSRRRTGRRGRSRRAA